MWSPDYFVRYVTLPPSVEGVTLPNNDGSFDIYINALLPEPRRRERLRHELEHIRQDHFYTEAPVFALERAAETGRPLRPRRSDPRLRPGERTRTIPLFTSLSHFGDFLDKLRQKGRCGDYIAIKPQQTEGKAK